MAFINVGHGRDQTYNPKASNGHRFIFVVVDYFTKWVEAASYASVTKSVVVGSSRKKSYVKMNFRENHI